MAAYKDLVGQKITKVTSNPSEPKTGQMWYNSTNGKLKGLGVVSAWRSGTSYSTAGYGAAGSGSLTAGLIAGRNTLASGDTPSNATEEWNGSGWATSGNLSNARYYAGALGTQTASLITGGDNRPPGSAGNTFTELYNGSSWTSGTAYPTAVTLASGLGTTPAGLMLNGGYTYSSTTNEYNGSWTSGGSLNTARRWVGTAGSQTAGLAFGGQIPPSGHSTNLTEAYDGSSWTNGANLNAARAVNAVGGGINQDASQTNALASGGYQSSGSPKTYFNETEAYDGTSWTAQPTMATARGYGTGGGTGSAGIVVGAYTGSLTAAVEEFNFSTNTITAGAWSAGANFPTSSSQVAGAGSRDAGLGIGGYPEGSSPTGKSYEYNGVAWSAEATLNPSTGTAGVNAAAGTQTACVNAQNTSGGSPYVYTATGEYDGSSWSNATARPTNNYANAACGTQTAGLFFGGAASPTSMSAVTLSYDGTNWTAEESLSTARRGLSGSGTSTAGLGTAGYTNPPSTYYTNTEEYGGESWTAGGSLLVATRDGMASGTQTDSIYFGGGTPTKTTATFGYDGTSWSTRPSLATARSLAGAGATSPVGAAWGAGGYYPGSSPNRTNTTEHFNVETTAANPASNITTS